MPLTVIEKLIPLGHPNRPGTKLLGVKARVWHGTANFKPGATDIMNAQYAGRAYKKSWNADKKKWDFFEVTGKPFNFGVAHVYIDVDSATIVVPLDEVTWNCGDRQLPYQDHTPGIEGYKGQRKLAYDVFRNQSNSYTWGIELCMNDMAHWDKVLDNALEFVQKYMPGLDKIDLRHYDITAKNCPSPLVNLAIKEADPRWVAFHDRIRKALM